MSCGANRRSSNLKKREKPENFAATSANLVKKPAILTGIRRPCRNRFMPQD
jgi:hypothetical protein